MNTNYKQVVSLILKGLRSENGLRIDDVAIKTRINQTTISRYENNPNSINLDILEKLIICYGITLSIFFDKCNAKMQRLYEEKGE